MKKDMQQSLVVLVSNDEEATIGAARELAELEVDYCVVQPVWDARCTYSRYMDVSRITIADTTATVISAIEDMSTRSDVYLIPLSDWGLELIERNRARLSEVAAFSSFVRDNDHARLYDKLYFYSICKNEELNIPAWRLLSEGLPDERWFSSKHGYIVKPVLKRFRGDAFPGRATSVADVDELRAFTRSNPDIQLDQWIIQHKIPGGTKNLRVVDFYLRPDGSVPYQATRRNLVTRYGGFGSPAITEITESLAIEDVLIRWLKEIDYEGGINAEFMYDEETGKYHLFDLNARCGGHLGFTYVTGGRMMTEILRSLSFPGLSGMPSGKITVPRNIRGYIRPRQLAGSDAPIAMKVKYLWRALRSFARPKLDGKFYYCAMYSADDPYAIRYAFAKLFHKTRQSPPAEAIVNPEVVLESGR